MRVLVTGSSGFVGSALSKQLELQRIPLIKVTRGYLNQGSVAIGEIDGKTNWSPLLRQCTTVVHLAARAHVLKESISISDSESEFRRINVDGTLNLARQSAIAGVKRLVFVSSIGVNGSQTHAGHAFSEADQPNPHNAYARSKWVAEQGLMKIATETGMEVVVIRPPLVYGANAPGNFGTLTCAVRRGLPLPLGAVQNQRSLVALDNLVDFIITCATHTAAANQTFLVSDGNDLSTTSLALGMAHALGVPSRLFPMPVSVLRFFGGMFGKADAIDRLCGNLQINSYKASTLLGWTPPISVGEGLRRLVS